MPLRPPRPCRHPGCRTLTRETYCPKHHPKPQDHRPPPQERGYPYRWRVESKAYLGEHPWCATCRKERRLEPATEVDHIAPHKGDNTLFWDRNNWQGLCKRCHSRKTAREDGGFGHKQKGNR